MNDNKLLGQVLTSINALHFEPNDAVPGIPFQTHDSLDFPFKIHTSSNLLDFQLCLLVTILIVTAHSVHD
jgi:hypothetical protein